MAARLVSRDRRGRPGAVVEWRDDGRLAHAGVRTPSAGWIVIEPDAGVVEPFGPIDRLWRSDRDPVDGRSLAALGHGATFLTVATAVDWTRPTTIPVVAEPARLPAGAGTAVLNLVATLALEHGIARLRYDGPYPTEALFLSLLECFDPEPADGDLLARFTARELGWTPAPFEPCFDDDIYTQRRRGRIEKVVWRERTYWREDWSRVRRRAPLRVDDVAATVRCALWALGEVLEEHGRLDTDGRPLSAGGAERDASSDDAGAPQPRHESMAVSAAGLAPSVSHGVIALIVATSAPPLAQALRAEAEALAWTIGPVDRNLAQIDGGEARVASTLAARVREALHEPQTREPRAALAVLAEIAAAFGDGLRARAQARLAAAPEAEQRAALEREHADDPDAARRITDAVRWLLASGGVEDQPDVEGGKAGDRDD